MKGNDLELGRALFTADTLLFSSSDPHQVKRDVASVFKQHSLRVRGSDASLRAQMSTVRRGNFSVSRLAYGADVEIDPDRLDDFFLVQIPVSGSADIACGGARFESTPEVASLVSPSLRLRMLWRAGNAQVCVRFERAFVERHCAAHLGYAPDAPLAFDPLLALDEPGARYFLRLLGVCIDELALARADETRIHPLMFDRVGDQFATSMLSALLYGQLHSFSDELSRSAGRVAPHCVRRAEEYIHEHYREHVTVEALAEIAGVSARTLFSGFRAFRNTTPMAYLKDLRLQRARRALLAGGAADAAQVTNIALDCGFSHLGRFASSYRARFGETPSATARFRPHSASLGIAGSAISGPIAE